VSLTALRGALSRHAREFESERSLLVIVDLPASQLDGGVLINPTEVIWERGAMRVARDMVFADDAPSEDELLARIAGLVAKRGADRASSHRYLDDDLWVVTIEVPLFTRGRTIGSAIDLADDLEALAVAPIEELDPRRVAEIIMAGQSRVLVGSYESEGLEVKRAPYRNLPTEQLELAKDVASFANRSGGLLLVGLKSKTDSLGDRIISVNECSLVDGSAELYRGTVAKRIYPLIEDLRVVSVPGTDEKHGVMMIEIPPQAEEKKPFLVHGVVVGQRVAGAYFSLPTRRGDDTDYLDIQVVHSLLRAGRSYLDGTHGRPRFP
jgi:hypothetical protein